MRIANVILFLQIVLLFTACKQAKYVPENAYLLKKNKIELDNHPILLEDIEYVLRQQPNQKFVGIPWKLYLYNLYDSTDLAKKRSEKLELFTLKIAQKKVKYAKINERRRLKAISRGKDSYLPKVLNDSVYTKISIGERIKYKYGQNPVVLDTILVRKTQEQMKLFLRKKGFYYSNVSVTINRNEKKRYAYPVYSVKTGFPYVIDTIKYAGNPNVKGPHSLFLTKQKDFDGEHPLIGKYLDVEMLDEHRYLFSRYMKDKGYHKFFPTNTLFELDTNARTMKVNVKLIFNLDPTILDKKKSDSLNRLPLKATQIRNVYFHLSDTLNVEGSFAKELNGMDSKDLLAPQFLTTTKEQYYNRIKASKSRLKNFTDLKPGDPDPYMEIMLKYNGAEPWIKPELLSLQNYLEHRNGYKEKYLERTYRSLQLLGVFDNVKPLILDVGETKSSNIVDAHYYLEPSEKHSFGFDPRFTTNTSGLLGLSAALNYSNKNIARGAQKLTFSFGGGFESQTKANADERDQLFNTLEIGPSLKFDAPGLFPIPITKLSKRQRPRTVISTTYNLEKRSIFDRQVFQLASFWKFYVGKTQIFQIGLPGASSIKYVFFDAKGEFENYLNTVDDPFFKNTYSKQFIWQDFKLSWEYNNKERDWDVTKRKKPLFNADIYFQTTIDAAGNMLRGFRSIQSQNNDGSFQFLNVPYSQFVRIDNQYILSKKYKKKSSLHFKANGGGGLPYLNSVTSMPYDYSFFAGGSNDNRGFRARTLGPGAYAYHLDSLRLPTQIGDIRLLASLEYRFSLGGVFKGALFADAGNIWTFKEDEKRPGSQFMLSNFYKEIALSVGVGLRFDFDFFVFRLDLGLPVYNPSLAGINKWYFKDLYNRNSYYREGIPNFGQQAINQYLVENPNEPTPSLDESWMYIKKYKLMPKPFVPILNFGIGYPF
jgi:outer membrane protein insertion porin family